MNKFILKMARRTSTVFLLLVLLLIPLICWKYSNQVKVVKINKKELSEGEKIIIYISGEVKKEGEYLLPKESRTNDLIIMAGGITGDASLEGLDLKRKLVNGDKIIIDKKPTKERMLEEGEVEINNTGSLEKVVKKKRNKININTCTKKELENLKGIGAKTSQKIIDYRKKSKFNSIEEIKEVRGIGEAKYSNIKNNITI